MSQQLGAFCAFVVISRGQLASFPEPSGVRYVNAQRPEPILMATAVHNGSNVKGWQEIYVRRRARDVKARG